MRQLLAQLVSLLQSRPVATLLAVATALAWIGLVLRLRRDGFSSDDIGPASVGIVTGIHGLATLRAVAGGEIRQWLTLLAVLLMLAGLLTWGLETDISVERFAMMGVLLAMQTTVVAMALAVTLLWQRFRGLRSGSARFRIAHLLLAMIAVAVASQLIRWANIGADQWLEGFLWAWHFAIVTVVGWLLLAEGPFWWWRLALFGVLAAGSALLTSGCMGLGSGGIWSITLSHTTTQALWLTLPRLDRRDRPAATVQSSS